LFHGRLILNDIKIDEGKSNLQAFLAESWRLGASWQALLVKAIPERAIEITVCRHACLRYKAF